MSRPKKSSGLAKPSGAAMRTGWRGRWLRPRQGGAVQPDSIGHWLFAERQIHRIYSSDHACRMQTILLEPFTCKRVHATLHSRIFCLGLMLIFHNVQAGFRQVVDVVRSCAAPRSLQQRVKNRGLCGWYMPVSRSKRSPIHCGDKFVRVAASRNSSSRRMLPPT